MYYRNKIRFLTGFLGLLAFASVTGCGLPQEQEQSPRSIDPLFAVAAELRQIAQKMPRESVSSENLVEVRMGRTVPPLPDSIEAIAIARKNGLPPVEALIFDYESKQAGKPVFLYLHGGGYIARKASHSAPFFPLIASGCECTVVAVDYRLAPETVFPGALQDSLTVLKWLHENAGRLGIDSSRIAIGGESAGGGLAAQLAIAARDNNIPVAFQMLIYPMLDDRTIPSADIPSHIGQIVWTAESNQFGWSSYLGQPAGAPEVPYGSVPSRVENLSGLAPAWIGVGSVDLFVSENILYAQRLINAGVDTELVVIPGAFHGFNFIAPTSPISQRFNEQWLGALRRALHGAE